MMYLRRVLVLCFLFSVNAEWLEELNLGKGIELGDGVSVHLDNLSRENASFLENHALRLDYAGNGISLEKDLDENALKVELYTKGESEGRKKNSGMFLIPLLLGIKLTGITALVLTGATLLVLKALSLAKLAAVVSIGLAIAKYFSHKPHVEVEQYPAYHAQPVILAEYPADSGLTASGNYLTYANYDNNEQEGSQGQYSSVPESAARNSNLTASKRNDLKKRKYSPIPYLSVKKYTIHH